MAITLRGVKGSALTHDELDNNFREFFYSGSIDGSELKLHRSRSIDPVFTLPRTSPSGQQFAIQVKSGSATSGSNSLFTGSDNFTYDFGNNILRVTGSSYYSGNIEVIGSVTATEFKTTLISSSIVFSSGSTLFGDTSDDTHTFTGSLKVSNGITGSTEFSTIVNKPTLLSSSAQIATDISGSFTDLSSSIQSRVTNQENFSSSLGTTFATNATLNTVSASVDSLNAATSSYLQNTTDTLTGDLTVTGTLTANTYVVSSSVTYLTTSFSSGSTQFGDSADDTHTFTGSVNISNDLNVVGTLTGNITGSATTASYINASNIDGTVANATSASFSTTASAATSITFNGGLTTTSDVRFDSLGIGTDASGTTGEIRATGDITAYFSSDERLKDNITPLSDAINKINQIGGYEFDWNSNSSHSGHDVGVIAQEIEKVLPEVVTQRDNGYLAVRYEKIVALLIQAVKEQQLQINELKSKL